MFFVLRPQDAINRIGSAVTRLVIMPDLHFAQQSDRKKIKSAEQKPQSHHHQRAMLTHNRNVSQELLDPQPRHQRASTHHADHAKCSKKVQRPGEITQQETNRDQIEKDTERARDAVVRSPPLTVDIADRDLADRSAIPRRERRYEPVKFTVKRYLLENLAAVSLESSSEVVNVHAAQLGHQPVGDAGRDTAHPGIIDAHLAPSADNVVTSSYSLEKKWDVRGIVLQIPVHSDNVLPPRVIESGGQSRGLTEVSAKLHHRNATVDCRDLA